MRWKVLLLYVIFFCSGASALSFETLWFRQASLALGSSIWAGSMVLAAFMGGLALGNWLAGRMGHRARNPIAVYAWLEIAIGVAGLGLVLSFPLLNQWFVPVFRPVLDQPVVLNGMRLGIGFLLLLFPTAAMGATLPLMVRGLRARGGHFGEHLGRLYAVNTLGAMLGAVGCEMFLIERLGVRGTGLAAAGWNLVAAVVSLSVSRDTQFQPDVSEESGRAAPFSRYGRRILVASFLAGATLLALEIVWFRFLLLFNFATSHIFAIMLAIVLAGIGLGGLLAARLLKRRSAENALPIVAIVSSILALLSFVGPTLAYLAMPWQPEIDPSGLTTLVISLPVILPVSTLSGVLFTLMGQCLHVDRMSDTQTVGYLTLFNTCGAMIGALAAGFVLLPGAGMEWSFLLLSGCYVVVALLTAGTEKKRSVLSLAAGWTVVVLIAGGVLGIPQRALSQGLFAKTASRYSTPQTRVVAVREGLDATIMYLESSALGQPYWHRLMTNAHSMSGTSPGGWQYMKMYVYLPVAIHPAPRKALLISYGCGVTAKALTDTAEFRQIDVVDISKDILDLSSVVYPEPSEHPLNDPRVTVFIEDGRFFLLTTSERYDLITGEPPPPKGAHIVNLYTREYFQLIHDRLAPGGMTTYWLPQDSLSHDDARGIMRAFCDVFENCSLWLGGGQNWMLVGIREGHRPVSEERFRRQWNDATVRPILQASGFETPEQMGSFYIADTKFLRELLRDDLPLVDNFPHRLSPTSSVLKPERQYAELLSPDAARQRFLDSELIDQLWPAPIREETAPYFDQRCFIHDLWSADRFRMSGIRVGSLAGVDHLMSANLETAVLWALASGYREQRIAERVAGELPDHPIVRFKLGHGALARRDLTKAVEHYERTLQNSERQSYHARRTALLCVYALCLDNRVEEARPMLDRWLHGEDLDPDQQADLEFLLTRFELLIPEKAAADSTTEP